MPIPFHSIFIVAAILFFEVNLPVGLALAWLSNPFTLVPILYIGFWIGTQIFHVHMINKEMMLGVLHQVCHWIKSLGHSHVDLSLAKILMSGLIIEAFVVALVLYLLTEFFWRLSIYRHWKKRKTVQSNGNLHTVHRKTTP